MFRRRQATSIVVVIVLAAATAVASVLGSVFVAATHDFPTVSDPQHVALIWRHEPTRFRQRTPLTLSEFQLLQKNVSDVVLAATLLAFAQVTPSTSAAGPPSWIRPGPKRTRASSVIGATTR
jgi:hypothetical protein